MYKAKVWTRDSDESCRIGIPLEITTTYSFKEGERVKVVPKPDYTDPVEIQFVRFSNFNSRVKFRKSGIGSNNQTKYYVSIPKNLTGNFKSGTNILIRYDETNHSLIVRCVAE